MMSHKTARVAELTSGYPRRSLMTSHTHFIMAAMPEQAEPQHLNLADLLPAEWFDGTGTTSVMQVVYSCNFFRPRQIGQDYLSGDIANVHYLVLDLAQGMPFHRVATIVDVVETVPQLRVDVQPAQTPSGTHIMFFTPYHADGDVTEAEALARIESARGLVSAVEGLNANYSHIFTRVLELPSGTQSSAGPVIAVPHTMPVPFVSGDRVGRIADALPSLDPSLQTRLLLGLRWFDKADRETDPVDAFLKSWFAVEVIGMPDTTNIRPVVEKLAAIYALSYQDAVTRFQIGRVQSLRADIVHNGLVRPIHQQLHRYVQAVFVDVLFHLTGQPSERRTEAVLQDATFAYPTWRP